MKAEAVLSSRYETFQEIRKATGIDSNDLVLLLEQYNQAGQMKIGLLTGAGCQVPVMRLADGLKPVWKHRRVKR